MEIRVVEVSTLATKYFTGHKAPILHVTIDPKMEYLVSELHKDMLMFIFQILIQIKFTRVHRVAMGQYVSGRLTIKW